MNAFAQAQQVETIAMQELMPWLTMKFAPVELCDNEFLQRTLGDFTITQQTRKRSVELKAEQRYTQNLFLETWSNLPAFTLGWMYTSTADLLAYYFCDNQQLYVFPLPELKRWAFGVGEKEGQIYKYREATQNRYNQINLTRGRIVPINAIQRAVPWKLFSADDRNR